MDCVSICFEFIIVVFLIVCCYWVLSILQVTRQNTVLPSFICRNKPVKTISNTQVYTPHSLLYVWWTKLPFHMPHDLWDVFKLWCTLMLVYLLFPLRDLFLSLYKKPRDLDYFEPPWFGWKLWPFRRHCTVCRLLCDLIERVRFFSSMGLPVFCIIGSSDRNYNSCREHWELENWMRRSWNCS